MEHLSALLDDAVADLQPRDPDPLATVVRRGRAARRSFTVRVAAAGAMAAVALIAGGVAVNARVTGGDADMPGALPVPHVVGHTVVAGDLRLPVPAGWRVVTASRKSPCGLLSRTILLVRSASSAYCQKALIEVIPVKDVSPAAYERVATTDAPGRPANPVPYLPMPVGASLSPVAITLAGGEPAWLSDAPELRFTGANRPVSGADDVKRLVLPWSQVSVTLRLPRAERQQIIASMRGRPAPATPLQLPDGIGLGDLVVGYPGGDTDQPHAYAAVISHDPTALAAVRRLLVGQRDVVDNDRACASASQKTITVLLATASDLAVLPSPTGLPGAVPQRAPTTAVVVSLGGRCQEAVSSGGGRVRLSDATVTELTRLFTTWVGK